jgi:hypothetical protein
MTDIGPGTTGEATGNVPGNGSGDSGPLPVSFPQMAVFPEPQPERVDSVSGQRITRQQAKEMQRLRREESVPFWLDQMGFEAQVKPLSFADKVALQGIDPRLQAEITSGFNARGIAPSGGNTTVTFHDLMRGVGNEEKLANAVCCAGFISPRLTLTEHEADVANNPDVWWVGDIHIDDRRKYSGLVLGQNPGEAKRIANFLSDRVANTGNS